MSFTTAKVSRGSSAFKVLYLTQGKENSCPIGGRGRPFGLLSTLVWSLWAPFFSTEWGEPKGLCLTQGSTSASSG